MGSDRQENKPDRPVPALLVEQARANAHESATVEQVQRLTGSADVTGESCAPSLPSQSLLCSPPAPLPRRQRPGVIGATSSALSCASLCAAMARSSAAS